MTLQQYLPELVFVLFTYQVFYFRCGLCSHSPAQFHSQYCSFKTIYIYFMVHIRLLRIRDRQNNESAAWMKIVFTSGSTSFSIFLVNNKMVSQHFTVQLQLWNISFHFHIYQSVTQSGRFWIGSMHSFVY